MEVVFEDDFNETHLNLNNWNVDTFNGYDVCLEEGKLKFSAKGSWCGAYVQPKYKIKKNMILAIEFDYTIGIHYRTADKPYIGFFNASSIPTRDNNYNMIRNDGYNSFLIFLADNYDTNTRTKISTSYENDNIIFKSAKVNYKAGETIHIKLLINEINKNVLIFINNSVEPILISDIPNWDTLGDELTFEINSNSYSTFVEYYDNFTIYYKNKYILKQKNNYYSIKSQFYDIKLDNYRPCNKDYEINGFEDLNELTKKIDYIEIEKDKEKVNDVEIFEFDLSNNVKYMEML